MSETPFIAVKRTGGAASMERHRTALGIAVGTLAILVGIALLVGARSEPVASVRGSDGIELSAEVASKH